MKKTLLISMIMSALLCGCGNAHKEPSTNSNNSSEASISETSNQQKTEVPDDEEVHIDESDMEFFESLDEFKKTEFYNKMKEEGFTPYLLEYDEERYSFCSIVTARNYYEYILYDELNEKNVYCAVHYDTYMKDVSEFGVNAIAVDSIITTAERNGKKYDVYISSSILTDERNYLICYLPFDKYKSIISADGAETPDEILEYFDDFELVPDNG